MNFITILIDIFPNFQETHKKKMYRYCKIRYMTCKILCKINVIVLNV